MLAESRNRNRQGPDVPRTLPSLVELKSFSYFFLRVLVSGVHKRSKETDSWLVNFSWIFDAHASSIYRSIFHGYRAGCREKFLLSRSDRKIDSTLRFNVANKTRQWNLTARNLICNDAIITIFTSISPSLSFFFPFNVFSSLYEYSISGVSSVPHFSSFIHININNDKFSSNFRAWRWKHSRLNVL